MIPLLWIGPAIVEQALAARYGQFHEREKFFNDL
jgi:hypothetical protein